MPVTLVSRKTIVLSTDSPNITVLGRVLSYSGSPLAEYKTGVRYREPLANFRSLACEPRVTRNTPRAGNSAAEFHPTFASSPFRSLLSWNRVVSIFSGSSWRFSYHSFETENVLCIEFAPTVARSSPISVIENVQANSYRTIPRGEFRPFRTRSFRDRVGRDPCFGGYATDPRWRSLHPVNSRHSSIEHRSLPRARLLSPLNIPVDRPRVQKKISSSHDRRSYGNFTQRTIARNYSSIARTAEKSTKPFFERPAIFRSSLVHLSEQNSISFSLIARYVIRVDCARPYPTAKHFDYREKISVRDRYVELGTSPYNSGRPVDSTARNDGITVRMAKRIASSQVRYSSSPLSLDRAGRKRIRRTSYFD